VRDKFAEGELLADPIVTGIRPDSSMRNWGVCLIINALKASQYGGLMILIFKRMYVTMSTR
jgi:hypothetical protein